MIEIDEPADEQNVAPIAILPDKIKKELVSMRSEDALEQALQRSKYRF